MHSNDDSATDYAFLARLNLAGRGGTTDHVQAILREAIVASDLPPGSLINKHAVCERLGVSRFPVSEALARLQAEGLVEILPQRGTRVRRLSIADMRENMFIRRAIESEAVRKLAAARDPAMLAALERNLRYQAAAIDAHDQRGFYALDLEFHQILVDALGHPRVKTILDAARGNLERVRLMLSTPWRQGLTLDEHRTVYEAIRAGDAEAAGRAMSTHLDMVIEATLKLGKSNPDVFDDGA